MKTQIEVEGLAAAIGLFEDVSKHADFAQRSAMRATRTKAATNLRSALAARWGVPGKVFKRRIGAYFHPKGRGKVLRLWLGLQRRPTRGEHARVAKALDRLGDRRRKYLPIEQGAEAMMRAAALAAIQDRYIPVLRRDFIRRVKRSATRRAKGRR